MPPPWPEPVLLLVISFSEIVQAEAEQKIAPPRAAVLPLIVLPIIAAGELKHTTAPPRSTVVFPVMVFPEIAGAGEHDEQ